MVLVADRMYAFYASDRTRSRRCLFLAAAGSADLGAGGAHVDLGHTAVGALAGDRQLGFLLVSPLRRCLVRRAP